jgi:hypothetical protein
MSQERGAGYLGRPSPSGLADVVEIILDKGIVIDAYARVSLLGIELITADARIVVASVDTYLRFAEATNRLELEDDDSRSLVDIMTGENEEVVGEVASGVVDHKVEGALDKVEDTLGEPAMRATRATAAKLVDVGEKAAPRVIDTIEKRG